MNMKAICDFTTIPSLQKQGEPFGFPACFLPLMGKAFVQHVLEYIERLGIQDLDIYLSQYADELEKFIGDGERWGVRITYHLLKQKSSVLSRIARDLKPNEDLFLLCNNLCLPFIRKEQLSQPISFRDTSAAGADSLWRVCSKDQLQSELPGVAVEMLSVQSAASYLESLKHILSRKGEGLIVMGKEVREGIWTGPGTKIPPTCTLVAPVYLGPQVSIGEQAIIGPVTEIGAGCIIDTGSYVIGSSVLAGSFVGRNLDVRGCIVNQNRILNAELSTVYAAADEVLFTAVEVNDALPSKPPVPVLSRLVALILGILTLPILGLLWLYQLIVVHKTRHHLTVVCHPQQLDSSRLGEPKTMLIHLLRKRAQTRGSLWKHFAWHLIPGFWMIVSGKARFFGIPYKTIEDFKHLSRDWQGLYLRSIPGIISEADIIYSQYPGDEMLFAAEMYYSVMESTRYNAKLLGRYLKQLFLGRDK